MIASTVAKRRDGGLRLLAREWGVAYTRASEMARIWREILKPMLDRGLQPPIELEQEYFHVALRSPEPIEAIAYAQDQKNQNSGFTCAKLKSALKTGMPDNIKNCSKCSHYFYMEDVEYTIDVGGKKTKIKGNLVMCRVFGVLRPLGNFNLQERAAECGIFADRERAMLQENQSLGTTSKDPLVTTITSSDGSSI